MLAELETVEFEEPCDNEVTFRRTLKVSKKCSFLLSSPQCGTSARVVTCPISVCSRLELDFWSLSDVKFIAEFKCASRMRRMRFLQTPCHRVWVGIFLNTQYSFILRLRIHPEH